MPIYIHALELTTSFLPIFGFIFRKHALTLQLHTANILSAHAALDEKNRAIQDVKEQKNKFSFYLS